MKKKGDCFRSIDNQMKILPLQDLFSNIRQKSTITNRNFWKVDTTHSGNLATSFSESGIMKVDQIFLKI